MHHTPLTHAWSLFARGWGPGGPPAEAGGPGGRNLGKRVVRVNVNAWNNEKIIYGSSVTVR
jgi:hypothetical protein